MADRDPLAGRVAVVTGGARGIGAAIGAALVRYGLSVALGDLDAAAAQATAAQITAAQAPATQATAPVAVVGLPLDVRDTVSYQRFLDAAEERLGPIDILVNNAGIMWVGAFDEESDDVAHRQFEVNLHGVLRGMKLAIPRMRARGRGHVVNVASAASRIAPAGEATYAATKHAVYGYSNAVRAELRGTGVAISVVMPSVVETELAAGTAHGAVRRLRPEQVAAAVVRVLRHPRFEVYVPARLAALDRLLGALPGAARTAAHDRLVPNQAAKTDRAAREAYQRSRFGN